MQKQRSSSNAIFLSTNDQRLLCHGQLWAPQEEIFHEAERGADYNSRINWPDGIIAEKNGKKALDYFNLFFPFQELPNILCYTNKVMSYKKYTPNVEYAELLRWIGIRLLGALERNKGNFKDNWFSSVTEGSMHRRGYYSNRCQMFYKRFSEIETSFRLTDYISDILPNVIFLCTDLI